MAAFWVLIGVMISVATLIMLLPWLRTVPHLGPLPQVSWRLAAAGAVALALAIGMYLRLGRPDLASVSTAAPDAAFNAARRTSGASVSSGAGSMSAAVAGLQARLAQGSGSADDWELLAKAYEFMGRTDEAALARAHQLPSSSNVASTVTPATPTVPTLSAASLSQLQQASTARRAKHYDEAARIYATLAAGNQLDADGWADYADTAATLQGNKLAGPPAGYIANALALAPLHPKALWLQASYDEEVGKLPDAIVAWRKLSGVLDPSSSDAKIVAANLQQDLKQSGVVDTAVPASNAALPAATTSPVSINGEVRLAAALSSQAAAGSTLFIVAKSVAQPGVPVAVYRGVVGAWPVRFHLDDSQAMLPGRNLSSAGRVTVEARISRSGQALPVSGDLSGSSDAIDPAAASAVTIIIDHSVP